MIFEGNNSVLDAIKEKKYLMDMGEPHEHIRPLLFVDGGLMKGAYGTGAGLALEELGYSDVFTSVVGVSSGAPCAAYFVSKEVYKGASLIYEECCSKKFLNMWRFWNQADTSYFDSALKNTEDKGIDTRKVLSSDIHLYIGMSDFNTGKPVLWRPKNEDELFKSIQASVTMPNISTDKTYINGKRYVDGGFTFPHILGKAISDIEATHLLVITNQEQSVGTIPLLERFLDNTLFRGRMSAALRFAAHERRKERLKVIDEIKNSYGKPFALIWGNNSIKSIERDPKKVKEVVEKSRLWWHEFLAK